MNNLFGNYTNILVKTGDVTYAQDHNRILLKSIQGMSKADSIITTVDQVSALAESWGIEAQGVLVEGTGYSAHAWREECSNWATAPQGVFVVDVSGNATTSYSAYSRILTISSIIDTTAWVDINGASGNGLSFLGMSEEAKSRVREPAGSLPTVVGTPTTLYSVLSYNEQTRHIANQKEQATVAETGTPDTSKCTVAAYQDMLQDMHNAASGTIAPAVYQESFVGTPAVSGLAGDYVGPAGEHYMPNGHTSPVLSATSLNTKIVGVEGLPVTPSGTIGYNIAPSISGSPWVVSAGSLNNTITAPDGTIAASLTPGSSVSCLLPRLQLASNARVSFWVYGPDVSVQVGTVVNLYNTGSIPLTATKWHYVEADLAPNQDTLYVQNFNIGNDCSVWGVTLYEQHPALLYGGCDTFLGSSLATVYDRSLSKSTDIPLLGAEWTIRMHMKMTSKLSGVSRELLVMESATLNNKGFTVSIDGSTATFSKKVDGVLTLLGSSTTLDNTNDISLVVSSKNDLLCFTFNECDPVISPLNSSSFTEVMSVIKYSPEVAGSIREVSIFNDAVFGHGGFMI